MKQLQNSFNAEIDFIPYRGDFPRGIFATLVVKCKVELEELVKMYQDYYAEDSFVHIVDKKYRFEAGGEHQQVFDSFGEAWR